MKLESKIIYLQKETKLNKLKLFFYFKVKIVKKKKKNDYTSVLRTLFKTTEKEDH